MTSIICRRFARRFHNTELTGQLEFDLFVHSWWPEGFPTLTVTLSWPEEWTYVFTEFCTGTGTALLGEGTLDIEVETSIAQDELTLLARVIIDAPCPGELDLSEPFDSEGSAYVIGARAGLACGNCPPDWYGINHMCVVKIDAGQLNFTAEQGGEVSDVVHFVLWDYHECTASLEATADWISCDAFGVCEDKELTVTADASSLGIGTHAGWIHIDAGDCTECIEVIFEVTADNPVESASWGEIKSVFR